VNGNGQGQGNEIGMQLQAGDAVNLLTGEKRKAESLTGVVAMAGIGHPPRFFATLSQLGVKTEREIPFADHQSYQAEQLGALANEKQTLLMTEKDAVKCRSFAQANWWYLPVDASFSSPDSLKLLERIKALVLSKD